MKQTITSKYEPKSKNVTWIDMSTGSPVLKNFINGKWRPVGSGGSSSGSGLPTVSAEDKGKVMQVVKAEKIGSHTETFDIIPELNLNYGVDVPYSNTDLTYFKEGNTITMVATFEDGTTETYTNVVMYEDDNESVYVGFDGEFMEWNWLFYEYDGGMWCDALPDEVSAYMESGHTVNIRLYTETEVPDYNYNWAPGVKIPIPTAEDEGKILVVTKVKGDNTSIIVPEQSVSNNEYFQNSDISKFVVGNEVKYTIGERGNSFTKTGLIINDGGDVIVTLYNPSNNEFGDIVLEDTEGGKALKFHKKGISFGKTTIKLEYIESNYEYQLQENSGGSSDVLWPALYEDENGNEIMATFVPEDVKPGTWCMVRGTDSSSRPVCYPALINEYGDYTLYSGISGILISVSIPFDGVGRLLTISSNAM